MILCPKYPRYVELLAILLVGSHGVGFAQNVTVRLIDVRNGQGARDQAVTLFLGDPAQASTPHLEATTSSDGVAVFHLPEAASQVFVYTENGHIRACARQLLFPTAEVFKNGITEKGDCKRNGKLSARFKAKPGEVIIFVRPLTLWERMQT